MNCLVCLCLNLAGPLRGVAGPPVTLVADLTSSLGGSRLMAVGGGLAAPAHGVPCGSRRSLWIWHWHRTAPHTCWRERGAPASPPIPSPMGFAEPPLCSAVPKGRDGHPAGHQSCCCCSSFLPCPPPQCGCDTWGPHRALPGPSHGLLQVCVRVVGTPGWEGGSRGWPMAPGVGIGWHKPSSGIGMRGLGPTAELDTVLRARIQPREMFLGVPRCRKSSKANPCPLPA